MAVPSPAVPTFTDGQVVHATDLNALGTNITNLFAYNQGGFSTQRPMVIAQQTTGQLIHASSDTLISFNSASVNTNNMWVASQATQITIQTAGVYWVFAQVRWPTGPSANWAQSNLMANGTNASANTVAMSAAYFTGTGSGTANQVGTLINLAAGATLYVDVFQTSGGDLTTATNFGGSFMGAIFLTPSS